MVEFWSPKPEVWVRFLPGLLNILGDLLNGLGNRSDTPAIRVRIPASQQKYGKVEMLDTILVLESYRNQSIFKQKVNL